MSLKYRLWLSFAPLLILLTGLGGGVVYALGQLGNRVDAILEANYRSVDAMTGLNEAAERIDSAFQFALAGQPGARAQYDEHWVAYRRHLEFERQNITEPGEDELLTRLDRLTEQYRDSGDRFFDAARPAATRRVDYYGSDDGPGPLQITFGDIKRVSGEIRRLNQDSMERASSDARRSAKGVRSWAAVGLVAAIVATGLLAWRTAGAILRPVSDLTRSAEAVGDGRFDQLVSAETRDEIGGLVAAFNRMTAQLRDLRQSHAARLLRAQQASQSAIDAFPDPVLVVDPNGRVEMANPAARRELGVVADTGHEALPWRPPDRLREPLDEALRDKRTYLTETFDAALTIRSGGEERVYLPQVLPVHDPYGATLGAAVVLNDVTKFRLLDEFKGDLVTTASHELKTPLAGLRLATHLLLEEAVGPLTAKQTELLVDARDNTERLVKIVDHLLSLARLERGYEALTLRAEDPGALLTAAAERVGPLVAGKPLVIEIESGGVPPIAADAERLGHALDNLLINASTYTDFGQSIVLSAKRAGPDRVELSVRDAGIGIPPEHLPHVFEKFFRIPGQSRGQGSGLGLAIVREIATAHGGTVTGVSEPGLGTTFRLVLPVWRGGGAA